LHKSPSVGRDEVVLAPRVPLPEPTGRQPGRLLALGGDTQIPDQLDGGPVPGLGQVLNGAGLTGEAKAGGGGETGPAGLLPALRAAGDELVGKMAELEEQLEQGKARRSKLEGEIESLKTDGEATDRDRRPSGARPEPVWSSGSGVIKEMLLTWSSSSTGRS
jgi:hypothetical protein